jgi:hypothetical protein
LTNRERRAIGLPPAAERPGRAVADLLPHCLRKFFDVSETTKSPVAREVLDRLGALCAVELKAQFASPK